ncbi:prepilin-type processing-associated H-X9-DG domain-containing protein [Neorhodopirellula lusitana]|uniref:Prepilin-type processing-associated H-X9-DG domain-containing protein n=1 Tax=Neorhodopirellula lusitana TaxID=445327 RepID=A0ABY1QMC7_9BACT|nr:prepilin-type processing-associated H-X9-DG domain-containing protein [Neorhodopirellula lusitana]
MARDDNNMDFMFDGLGPASCQNFADPERPRFYQPPSSVTVIGGGEGRGRRWADGRANFASFHTMAPPNKASCSSGGDGAQMMSTAGSRHQGGCHILMGDGAVKFVTDSIEAGNQTAGFADASGSIVRAPGTASPYGLWGSLGTRAMKETIEEEL